MAALLRAGEVSSRELTEAHLAAAERQNHALHAWLAIDRAGALAQADAADRRLAAGPHGRRRRLSTPSIRCCGVPVGLKDLVSVKGGQATAGSRILEGYVAPFDSTVAARLREAGAVILGKTNMDEFAMGSSTRALRRTDPRPTRGTSTASPAAARAARPRPSPRSTPRSPSARTPAAASASPPRCAGSSA